MGSGKSGGCDSEAAYCCSEPWATESPGNFVPRGTLETRDEGCHGAHFLTIRPKALALYGQQRLHGLKSCFYLSKKMRAPFFTALDRLRRKGER